MRLGVVLESDFETRVSIVPNSIPKLLKMGFEVFIEDGAVKNQVIQIQTMRRKVHQYLIQMKYSVRI